MGKELNTPLTRVHIFGAGLAGLSAAVYCLQRGFKIRVYEAANHAGGRCRSFHDSILDCLIDNGNHLILGGNRGIFDYLRIIGADKGLQAVPNAFPFIDLKNAERWTLQPGNVKLPFWIFLPHRRIPGTHIKDYLVLKKLATASPNSTLINHVDPNTIMFKRFWEPLSNAVLNTDAREGSARLLGKMLELTLLRGPAFAQPFLTPKGLSAALVDPAIKYLAEHKCSITFGARVRSISFSDSQVENYIVGNQVVTCRKNDHIILALPPNEIAALVPEVTIPTKYHPIVNIHFKPNRLCLLPNDVPFIGIINGMCQWVFRKNNLLSVTISNAKDLVEQDANILARQAWQEVATIIPEKVTPLPPYRVLKERRATISQTPAQDILRPNSYTKWENLHLAGDWINTGLPATIESAVQSGQNAAETVEKSQIKKNSLN